MKNKKIVSCLLAASMLASGMAAFAAPASDYDEQPYSNFGYTSEDPDGEINLAVIANGDVTMGNASLVEGSIYSNGKIYSHDGQINTVKGLFISGTENTTQYVVVDKGMDENFQWLGESYEYLNGYFGLEQGNNDLFADNATWFTKPEYEGAILDKDTSFDYEYEKFEIPQIDNNLGDVEMNVYTGDEAWDDPEKGPRTITEDTRIENLIMNGTQDNWMGYDVALTIDTTDGDVNLVIDNLEGSVNPSIKVIGDNMANIYITTNENINNIAVNCKSEWEDNWRVEEIGNSENTNIYITSGDGSPVVLSHGIAYAKNIFVNADELRIEGTVKIISDISTGAETFIITGGETEVEGTVFAPNAASSVVDSGTLYGQIYTDTLEVNGWGRIIWREDSVTGNGEITPTEEPSEEPTEEPKLPPSGDEISLKGVGFAYIFGYEPDITEITLEDGTVIEDVRIRMGPDDDVTREQVAAMFMRLLDQNNNTKGETYSLGSNMYYCDGEWFTRGMAYLSTQGAFDGVEAVYPGVVPRGEVAKLLVFALNLKNSGERSFTDIAGTPYEEYIKIANAHGYMTGNGDGTFNPNSHMTRAEFCAMFNKITGRDAWGLTTTNGTEVTPETYFIADFEEGEWYIEDMLKATSAYNDAHLIDLETRQANMRNILDNYDAQTNY